MAALGLSAAWLGAVGTTRYVDDLSCPAAGSGTFADPYCKIQDAICASASGDTIRVLEGNYPEAIRMRPGVSLIAAARDPGDLYNPSAVIVPDPNGPATHSINSAGKPCTDSTFCAKRPGSQCSVVTFGSGHSPSTVLQGFTITGGAGRLPVGGDTPGVGGGGIYIFSSPTIINNVITNNLLAGPPHDLRGAGVYVSAGSPVITGNIITGNQAVPPAGTSGNSTFGYGGGIWINSYAYQPTVSDNVIQSNKAGDPNLAFSLGGGGGIVVLGAPAGNALVTIDRNLIADNAADLIGGGLSVDVFSSAGALNVVTNNVIVGNTASNGAGAFLYLNRINFINNTVTSNTGFLGGGVFLGRGDVALPVSVSNNIIESNMLRQFGNAGGIYVHDLDPNSDATIEYNDLWGNQVNQIAGDRTDANTIGVAGNFSADPLFVNRPGRNYHLDPNSPAIDRAFAAKAPPVDKDNHGRGVDGNGTPNDPQAGDVDVGAFELVPSCTPGPEVCDNLDNNCNGFTDDGLGSTTCGVGTCQTTVQNCVGGVTQTCTPGAPTTEVCDNLDNNCDGSTDNGLGSTTCGLGTCETTAQNCVGGVTQSCTPGTPTTEVCDNLDNNCDGLTDEGFVNTDGDSLANCVDPDDDNDSVLDGSDCAPLDPTAFGNPDEVGNVEVAGVSPTTVTFDLQGIGSGAHYEIISGLLSRLREIASFGEDFCLISNETVGSYQDSRPAPPPGDGWYYLVRSANTCGTSTYGSPLSDEPRSAGVCPGGIWDLDSDGSPDDLDCNDADPAISPIAADLCNGVDDNCNVTVDEGFVSQPTTCGVGACESMGGTICVSGVVGDSCVPGTPGPSDTTCNGVDENCNGQADEQFTPEPTSCGVGVCQSTGVSTCESGVPGSTCVPGAPMTEVCDNLDNNCDSVVDDGFDVGGACTGQTGTCQGAGTTICDPEGSGTAICNAFLSLSLDLMGGSQVVLEWTAFPGVGAYDLVRGDLATLITSSGDFTISTDQCLADNLPATSIGEPSLPAPGSGFWYLVRGSSCGVGSYEEGGSQVGLRGSEIQASALACP